MSDSKPVVLFVDDEINILRAVKRALYKLDLTLLFADTPEKALELVNQHVVDVVVSDMKMPNMNGAQLLSKIAQSHPNTFRVVMTGYADVNSMLDAVNEGQTHRIINKPWKQEELLCVIEEGTERTRLRRENARLLAVTQNQNELLQDINAQLEQKVALRTKQIKQALKNIQMHNDALEKVLYNVIVINPNIDGAFARKVSNTAVRLGKAFKLDSKALDTLIFAGLICEIGLLGVSSELLEKPFNKLNYEEQKAYYNQANLAQLILSPVSQLQDVISLVTEQFFSLQEHPDLSIKVKILAAARDYWRYRIGRINGNKMTHKDTLKEMHKYSGQRYADDLINALENIDADFDTQHLELHISSDQLNPGMQLKEDLFNTSHILLLPKGHIFSNASINKLKQFEKGQNIKFEIYIEPEQNEETQSTEAAEQ